MDLIFSVIYNLTKGVLFFIDNIVYSFIPILYKLLLYLASVDLLTDNVPIQSLVKRVYILVGVFMLFRLSFSIVNYIIYPDSFSDNARGFNNLVKRSLVALALLVGIPWFFTGAYFVQAKIITSDVIPRLILGNGGFSNQSLESSIETSAVDLQFLTFGPFFSLNYNSSGLNVDDASGDSSSGDLAVCKPTKDAPMLNVLGSSDMASNQNDCLATVAKLMDKDPTVKTAHVTLDRFFRSTDDYGEIVDYRNFKDLGGLLSWTLSDGEFAVKYFPIASTLCGLYLVFLLLSFCIDVAARIIRLLFLQILSPIAVISSVDPTSNGDRLKEWGRECLTVWASLFIRLAVIFLIIQLARVISNGVFDNSIISDSNLAGTKGMSGWLYLFLVLGIFTAAKKIPELLEKATGLKLSGELELNPFKNPFVGAGVGLGLAGIGVAGANAWAGLKKIGGYAQSFMDLEAAKFDLKRDGVLRSRLHGARLEEYAAIRYHGVDSIQHITARERRRMLEDSYLAQYDNSQKIHADRVKALTEAQATFDSDMAEYKENAGAIVRGGISSVFGIGTGAVSGAVRGAVGGYGKDLPGAFAASNAARKEATDAREDRDIRGEVGMNLYGRMLDSIDRWAGVRTDKNYGAGRLDDEVKALRNELDRVQYTMRASLEELNRAQVAASGISDVTLKKLVASLNDARSVEQRVKIIDQLSSYNFSNQADSDLIRTLIASTQHADHLLEESIKLQKDISKRENAANIGSGNTK